MLLLDEIREQFRIQSGYEPDLLQPRTFNEKIQWLKLFYHDPLLSLCADKITAKNHVARLIGPQHCVPTIAVLGKPEDLLPEHLTRPCVLKLNNGSGEIFFVTDPGKADLAAIRALVSEWLRPDANHYFFSAEWAYRDIASKVLIEPLIASPEEIVDYKLFCFGGDPKIVMTCSERTTALKSDFFDVEWNHLPFTRHYPNKETPPGRPARLNEMIELARKLAAPFPFVRVDFYDVRGGLFLGELTFYPGNGMERFNPESWDLTLGNWLTLPKMARISPTPGAPPMDIPFEHARAIITYLDSGRRQQKHVDDEENIRLHDKIHRMQNSFSWRATAPLRALRRKLASLATQGS